MNPRGAARYPTLTRRGFLRAAGLGLTGAGAAALVGCGGDDEIRLDGELETTRIRIPIDHGICWAPQLIARDFLFEEGFKDVEYVPAHDIGRMFEASEIDISQLWIPVVVDLIDRGRPMVAVAGVHVGCYEVFARDGIKSLQQLGGKRFAVFGEIWEGDEVFLASVLQFVGIPPEFQLVAFPSEEFSNVGRLFQEGAVDAMLAPPPFNHQMREMGAGHVILNSMVDQPWSDYYCCALMAHPHFVKKNPNATLRAVRAVLRGADLCANEPDRAARYLVDNEFAESYEHARATVHAVHYDAWRALDPQDSLLFYALRLHETGYIKTTPRKLMKKGTDWRFLNELKREMAYFPPADRSPSAFSLDCAIEGPQEG